MWVIAVGLPPSGQWLQNKLGVLGTGTCDQLQEHYCLVPPVWFVLKEVSLVVDLIYVELLSAICNTFKPKERVAAYDIFFIL